MAVLMAGTANGRVRWIDVERGLLKADVYCRPLGKSMVSILCVCLSFLLIHSFEVAFHSNVVLYPLALSTCVAVVLASHLRINSVLC